MTRFESLCKFCGEWIESDDGSEEFCNDECGDAYEALPTNPRRKDGRIDLV